MRIQRRVCWRRWARRTQHIALGSGHLGVLRRVVRHLSLPQLTTDQLRAAEGERSHDEVRSVAASHGMPDPSDMEIVRKFYAPFNVELARLLGDSAFMWRPSSPSQRLQRKALAPV